jgi:hypothetical protein
MEAVLLSYAEYERLKNLEDIFERMEIQDMVEQRFKNYNSRKNIAWEKIREDA